MLRESERWVHVPPSGTLDEDADRLLVYLPGPRDTSRVWRSRPGSGGAEALILRTIEEARGAGASRIVWHTGDGVSPPSMDDLLPRHGFEKTEDLEVLAFEMGTKAEPDLPMLRVRAGVGTRLVANEADLRRANAVEGDVFPPTVWSEPDARAYLRGLWRLDGRRGRLHPFLADVPLALRYLAFLPGNDKGEERAVATAGAEVAGETVRLWGAGTLAEYRGRGAYVALVMERCRHAHALGATLVLAKANASSSAPSSGAQTSVSWPENAAMPPRSPPRSSPIPTGGPTPWTNINLNLYFMLSRKKILILVETQHLVPGFGGPGTCRA